MLVVLDLVKPIFVCAILGESADGLGCLTTFVEIAHMKMGVISVELLEPIVACDI